MKAITILRRCREAGGDMSRIFQRIDRRREAMLNITPPAEHDGGGRGTSEQDKFAALVGDIDGLERAAKARQDAYRVELAAACVLLDALPEAESGVLHEYYVKGQKVSVIALKKGCTDGYIRKVKAEAERLLSQIPEERVVATLPAWYLREGGKPLDALLTAWERQGTVEKRV